MIILLYRIRELLQKGLDEGRVQRYHVGPVDLENSVTVPTLILEMPVQGYEWGLTRHDAASIAVRMTLLYPKVLHGNTQNTSSTTNMQYKEMMDLISRPTDLNTYFSTMENNSIIGVLRSQSFIKGDTTNTQKEYVYNMTETTVNVLDNDPELSYYEAQISFVLSTQIQYADRN